MKHRLVVPLTAVLVSVAAHLMQADEKPLPTPEAILTSATTPVQHQDIPKWAADLFFAKNLNAQYDFALALTPSCLIADFNGDGKVDVAVLVKQRSTGKLGLAIIHGATNTVTILGAGTPMGNGGDDFAWMDSWQIYSKARAAHAKRESGMPRIRGDALLVSKTEAASALIYWNGKRYVWLQHGD